jgi:zinc protease
MKRVILFIFLVSLSFDASFAQEVKNLPRDPRVNVGKMANGFSYYIVKNDKIKGYADFYLVQKVGASLENENQKGMTAIIGDMGVRGTRNFPGYTILSYLDQLGLEVRKDFNIVNGQNESIYKLASVPVGKSKLVIDSTLLILFNWACGINIDEEDVERERTFYKNVFAGEMNTDLRNYFAHKNNILGPEGNLTPAPEVMINNFDKYTSKDLRNYYYTWYRPERQALIVVGDIDALSLETQIKTLFQASPRYLEPNTESVQMLPDKEASASVVLDAERTECDLSLYFKTNALPLKLRSSAVPYVLDYMNDMMLFLIKDRLSAVANDFKAPITSIDVSYDFFMDNISKEALKINVKTFPLYTDTLLHFITKEIYRIKNQGFTKEEFVKARDRYYRKLNYVYDWRIIAPNSLYVKRCIYNYFGGYPLSSIEMNKEYMDVVRYDVGLSQFNTFVASYLHNGDNCVITCSLPENISCEVPSEEKLVKIFKSAVNEASEPYFYHPTEITLPEADIKPGTIVTESKELITNSKLWTLSNGATVVFKQTQSEPDKFNFNAVAKGGLSLMMGKNGSAVSFINEMASLCKLGKNDAVSVARLLAEKEMNLKKEITVSTNSLRGNGYSSNIEEMMKLIYLHFSSSAMDTEALEKYKALKKEQLKYRDNSPENVFADSLKSLLYMKSSIVESESRRDFDDLDYKAIYKFIVDRYSNAANYTFIFVGDIQEQILKDFVCKYIASAPGNSNKKESWVEVPFYLDKYGSSSHIEKKMELPRTIYNVTLAGASQYNMEQNALMGIVSKIIERRVKMNLMKCGISATCKTDFVKYPEEFMTLSFSFVSEKLSDGYIDAVNKSLTEMAENGADESEINIIKSTYKSKFLLREKTDNNLFSEILVNRFLYGKDFYTRWLPFINSASEQMINDALKKYVTSCTRTVLTMSDKNE